MNVYDFDGTIYHGDSSVDFFLFALKRKPALIQFLPTQSMGFVLYSLKRIGKTELKERFFSFLSAVDVEKQVEVFWDLNQHKIFKWYLEQQRPDDIIISASPEFLLKPICRRLGVNRLIASRVDTGTGKFIGDNCRGEEKVRRFVSEYHVTQIDKFYSDSCVDLPLAQIADRAFLIKNGTVTEWKGH